MNMFLLVLLAIVPALAIAFYFYLRDRREPEPSGLLLLTMLYGATAFFLTRGIGFLLHNFIYADSQDLAPQLISAFVFVGLLGKGLNFFSCAGLHSITKVSTSPLTVLSMPS